MAEVTAMPGVNGYAPHQGYGGIEQSQYNANAYNQNLSTSQAAYAQPPPTIAAPAAASSQQEISKDEVGWYFVEQYYTTLSRSPEKLYLFYNKRSQLVSGNETEKVDVCVGQRAINDKIKDLDFQDCKVRVTNVDSQASDTNIVIQVIGEISNKSQPHRKFTQTFVLATQTNGYFVLNDIFRYLIDEEEEQGQQQQTEKAVPQQQEEVQQAAPAAESGYQEPAPTAEQAEPKTLTSSMDPKAVEHDAKEVDKELEDKVLKTEEAPKAVNGTAAPEQAEQAAAPQEQKAAAEQTARPEAARQDTAEADLASEKPKDPSPSPAPTTPAAQEAPSQPAPAPKPVTWANLAATANKSAVPAVPVPAAAAARQQPAAKPATKPAQAPAAQPAPTQQAATPPAGPASQREESTTPSQDEWTSVTSSHGRQQSRAQNTQQQEQPQNRGYIKNVHEGVDDNALKEHLKRFGEISYFDVARQKNCAFVDFATPAGYSAAVAANPHQIGNEKLYVEERRVRPGSTPYVPRGQFQGGRGGRGGMQGAPRGGFQGRGGYAPRGGRGGPAGGAPRGRGGA
ncbi:hypothetical protein KC345_g1881 [Hortaea werneckii]|nr:hypothetical protein KC345_g1881 [Hortaea werneckii]